jgi:chemotaxis signal transduction protein
MTVEDKEPVERRTEILKERAAQLARPVEARVHRGSSSVAVMAIGAENVAIPAGYLREIIRAPQISAIPCPDPWISGITQIRGELVGVVDLALLLGVGNAHERAFLAMVAASEGPIGFLVDRVIGFREIDADDLSSGTAVDSRRPVKAITKDLVTILDMDRLLASEGLIVGLSPTDDAAPAAAGPASSESTPEPGSPAWRRER